VSKPLSLRFVLQHYFPYGGQQRDFVKIANTALSRGHRVQALVQTWEGDIPDGIEVVRLSVSGHSNHRRLKNFGDAVQRYRNAYPVDVQIGFMRMAGLDVYFAADPCYRARSLRRYGYWLRLLPRFRVLSAMEAAVFSAQSTTHVLALTTTEVQIYQQVYGTADARFTLLSPGVTDDFQLPTETERETLRQQYGLKPDAVLLLMVGSHFQTKGVDRSLRALAHLAATDRSRCQLAIAGAGNPGRMVSLAQKLGIADSVVFLGGRSDVAQWMQAADLLLQPSRTELAGMTIVEALSCQLPVIASGECGYASHIRQSGAGRALATPFTQSSFAEALQHGLDPAKRQAWRTAAAHYSNAHSLRGLATAAIAVIERLGSERRAER